MRLIASLLEQKCLSNHPGQLDNFPGACQERAVSQTSLVAAACFGPWGLPALQAWSPSSHGVRGFEEFMEEGDGWNLLLFSVCSQFFLRKREPCRRQVSVSEAMPELTVIDSYI